MGILVGENKIVTDGLVNYIDGLNKISYPGSGTTITDLMGTANYTISGDPTFNTAGYWDMDGSGDIFTCSNDLGSPTTVSNDFWINIQGETNKIYGGLNETLCCGNNFIICFWVCQYGRQNCYFG